MIGRALSHFRITAKLGEGGMGVVYRAEDERLRRQVALKVLPPELVSNEERRLRFLREPRALLEPQARGSIFVRRHQMLGRVYEALGKWKEAAAEYEGYLREPRTGWPL